MKRRRWSESQAAAILDIYARPNQFHFLYGQPRSGKSAVAVAALCGIAYAQPGTYGIVAVTLRQASHIVMGEARRFCQENGWPFAKLSDKVYRIGPSQFHLFAANNNRASITLQGYTLAGFYIDEVVNVPENVMLEITNRLSEVETAKVLMTANTGSPNSWFYKDYLHPDRAEEIGLTYHILNMSDNPSLSERFKQSIVATSTGHWYARRVQNLWVPPYGNVYVMPRAEKLPYPREEATEWRLAVDPADSSETHVMLMGRFRGRWWFTDEWTHNHVRRGALDHLSQVKRIKAWSDGLGVGVSKVVYDPEKPNFGKLLRRAYKYAGLSKAKKDRLVGINRTQYLMDTKKFNFTDNVPRCYDQMVLYAWDEKKAEQGIDDAVKWNDHGPDCVRYAAMMGGL